ncbi:heme-copper oxidase subunit III [Opitutus sp. GAS368]|jgi:cytochrome o ubiquinol oxidase subunit 3|uniref:cytochrome c oxidase subunit 3 n=1 Tax=Opitutus sp. GAS368 TaxID=1882749 RepID=UPI00087AA478|nr:heme-copper oxidase subunit III [Opitutus sp. GAS368]SDR70793.1 cytochrome o ubiquinol oxidase subunit 3 [Opitutus sp. GAS368]
MSSHAATIDHHHDATTATGIPNKKLLWWAFLASDCMFFGALISTHLVYRLNPPPGNAVPTQVFNIELTSFSTFILLMSSLLMALAVNAIQRGNVRSTRTMLLGTMFFGCIFLGGQVFEFTHFVYVKKMTLSNSIFGSTFFTLTGTHGTHVAIGVLLLGMMYVRTFKPADGRGGGLMLNFLHLLAVAVTFGVAFIWFVPGMIEVIYGASFPELLRHHAIPFAAGIVGLISLIVLGRTRGAVEFGEKNAIDVEAIGLYWHFVDIVWIIIFTAVYLLEYL